MTGARRFGGFKPPLVMEPEDGLRIPSTEDDGTKGSGRPPLHFPLFVHATTQKPPGHFLTQP
jgi:hypothetical protein